MAHHAANLGDRCGDAPEHRGPARGGEHGHEHLPVLHVVELVRRQHDASRSDDYDSRPGTKDDILSSTWKDGSAEIASGPAPTASATLAFGRHDVTLTVTDLLRATDDDRLTVEVSRGCGNGCRFCLAGFGYRPYRERSFDAVRAIIDRALRETGYGEISLLSLTAGEYGPLLDTIGYVRDAHPGVSLSLPSLKIGSITEAEIGTRWAPASADSWK